MAYDRGDVARLGNYSGATISEAFKDLDGDETDPTAVTLTVRPPDGDELVYGWPLAAADGTLSRETIGRFYRDVQLDQSGVWAYTLTGTGTAAGSGSRRIIVRSSEAM